MIGPAAAVRAVVALGAARADWTVLVDGRSGAGKSTLAHALVDRTGAALVRLDDCYPGWDGLLAGAEAVTSDLLVPRRTGRPGGWRRWDWAAGEPAERHVVPPSGGLVVEGSGLLSRRSAPLADLALWLELDAGERRRRALARDGAAYEPHWDRWAAQEAERIAAERPRRLADLVVDGEHVQALPSGRTARIAYRGRP
ncbi:hypothetical protein [Amnibacterium endophyticum]|uniref:ATP-binding protein n=1 Tax=Amnibacterium endophyticum TaxID=2109337 RepID=A0ABW4LKU7_9MICO